MAKNIIAPQYTVDTYVAYLKNNIENQVKWSKQQGIRPDVIDSEYNKALAKLDTVLKQLQGASDTVILQQLSLCLDTNTRFCKTNSDIWTCACKTVKTYCDKDIVMAVGLESLAQMLINKVPEDCWYATDMSDTGKKVRMSWCACVFPATYKRPIAFDTVGENTYINHIIANIRVTVHNNISIGNTVCKMDLYSENGNVMYSNVMLDDNTLFCPKEPLTLCLYFNGSRLLVRIWLGDDSSGIKGRKALFVSVLHVETQMRYKQTYTLN